MKSKLLLFISYPAYGISATESLTVPFMLGVELKMPLEIVSHKQWAHKQVKFPKIVNIGKEHH